MSVLLGIDLGDRRIGVALAETTSGAIRPLLTLRRSTAARDAAAIDRICREHSVESLVVGLPLHLDGRESEQSRRTREWVDEVAPDIGVPITLHDERLSSRSAEARLGRTPRGRSGGAPSAAARGARRARIDREAAAAILQRALDDHATMETPR